MVPGHRPGTIRVKPAECVATVSLPTPASPTSVENEQEPRASARGSLRFDRSGRLGLLDLDLDIDAGRQIEPLQRVHRLGRRIQDDCEAMLLVASKIGPDSSACVRFTVPTLSTARRNCATILVRSLSNERAAP